MNNEYKNQLKSAFTLIEMIIVMAIIGVLALVSVSSYSVVQRHTRFDIALDTLISVLKEQRDKARAGGQNDNMALSCYGLIFRKQNQGTDTTTEIASMRYVAVDDKKNRADFCDPALSFIKKDSGVTGDLQVKNIALGNNETLDSLALFFKPPLGLSVAAKSLDDSALNSLFPVSEDQNPIKITLGLSNTEETRTFIFDIITGEIKKLQ